jgi:hypothetical protein
MYQVLVGIKTCELEDSDWYDSTFLFKPYPQSAWYERVILAQSFMKVVFQNFEKIILIQIIFETNVLNDFFVYAIF